MSISILIGHRGSPTIKPENTIASFKEALDEGMNSIELDVRAALDGIVVMHDCSVNRTTNGAGTVASLTLEKIAQLKSREESVPTLGEALKFLSSRCHKIFIEIKSEELDIEERVLEVVANSLKNYDSVVITSFYPDILARVKELQPELETGIIFHFLKRYKSLLAIHERIETDYLIGGGAMLQMSHFVTEAKCRHFKLIVFDISSRGMFKRAEKLGLDGIITDLPHVLREISIDTDLE